MSCGRMLHWPHSLFNRLKGGGMCAQMCSMSCWGPNPQVGSLYKTTQPEGKATTCSWSTGAALLSLIQHKKEKNETRTKLDPVTCKQTLRYAPMVAILSFFSASLYNSFLQSYKANTVVAEIRVNTGCCDVCVVSDWPYAVDIPDI